MAPRFLVVLDLSLSMILLGSHRFGTPQTHLLRVLLSVTVFAASVFAQLINQLLACVHGTDKGLHSLWQTSQSNLIFDCRPLAGPGPKHGGSDRWPGDGANVSAIGASASLSRPEAIAPVTLLHFELPTVLQPTIFIEPMYRIEVPDYAVSLVIDLESTSRTGGDIDLYVSRGAMPTVTNGIVASDFAALGPTSVERIVINRTTSPPLEPGTYYIALALATGAIGTTGALRVTIETDQKRVTADPFDNLPTSSAERPAWWDDFSMSSNGRSQLVLQTLNPPTATPWHRSATKTERWHL